MKMSEHKSVKMIEEAYKMAIGEEAWNAMDGQQRHDAVMMLMAMTVKTLEKISEEA